MYGFIHCALEDLVVSKYGKHIWKQVLQEAGIELGGGSFLIHKQYTDNETKHLLETTANVLGQEFEFCLEQFGEHFFKYCTDAGYNRFLRVLGNTLGDFLCNLDALHDHFDAIYPSMSAPSFRCTPTDDGGLLLHYYSKRRDLYPFVIGIVRAASRDFFEVDINIQVVDAYAEHSDHVVLLIKERHNVIQGHRRRSNSLVTRYSRFKMSTKPGDLALGVRSFCKCFPFHVVLDRNLHLVQVGVALGRVLKRLCGNKKKLFFKDVFVIQRPVMDLSFSGILNHVNSVFVVYTQPNVLSVSNACMHLKGQMVYIPESDCILFLCSPRVSNLEDLKCKGLYLSDIPLHDATRDLVLITQARRAERELVEKMEETSNNLQKLQTKLQEDKQRTDYLLHSILPSKVAERLRLNLPVEAERYSLVTVLFSDIVQFTSMCGDEKVVPMDIVRMLNKLYTQFDMLSSLNGVYKVETIGDAYMVVGGLPEYTVRHADQVVSMAFGMMQVAHTVHSPVDNKPIKIRIGIHSGECVAGVVGQRMPRYCLFGHTVAMASKMEGLSKPEKINISESAVRYLTDPTFYQFEENRATSPQLCFFIHTTPSSPRPLTMDLSLPLPKGMFRTPNPSPVSSLNNSPAITPCGTTPRTVNSPEFKPKLGMPAIQITSADDELLTICAGAFSEITTALNKLPETGSISQEKHRQACETLAQIVIPECETGSTPTSSTKTQSDNTTSSQSIDISVSDNNGQISQIEQESDGIEKGTKEVESMERRRKISRISCSSSNACGTSDNFDIATEEMSKYGKNTAHSSTHSDIHDPIKTEMAHARTTSFSTITTPTNPKSCIRLSPPPKQKRKCQPLVNNCESNRTPAPTPKPVPQGVTLPFTPNMDARFPIRGIYASHSTGSIRTDSPKGFVNIAPSAFSSQYSIQSTLQAARQTDGAISYDEGRSEESMSSEPNVSHGSGTSSLSSNVQCSPTEISQVFDKIHDTCSPDKQSKNNAELTAPTSDKKRPNCFSYTIRAEKEGVNEDKHVCSKSELGKSMQTTKMSPSPASSTCSEYRAPASRTCRHHSLQETFTFGDDLSKCDRYSVNGYIRTSSMCQIKENKSLVLYFKGNRPRSISPRRAISCGSSPRSKTPEPERRTLFMYEKIPEN